MDQVTSLIERYFSTSLGQLCIGQVSATELANQYGTPLFIYDRSVMERKWRLLRDALPPPFSILYSMKANPNQAVLRLFLAQGAGLEIASGGEFSQGLAAGCPADRIVFAGPGKSPQDLELVLAGNIGEIHVESIREAERINEIARRRAVVARIAVRVNPAGDAEGGAMRMGGRAAPFGFDEEILDDVLNRILRLTALDLRGVHIFTGTQILDSETLIDQYRKGLAIARRVAIRLKQPLSTIDFGGGLGIPYFDHENELDVTKLKAGLRTLFEPVVRDTLFSATRCFVEPGRYLAGEAGIYVARITDIKVSRGKKFLIVDGGMNHHLAASGNLGQTIKRNFPIAVLNRIGQPAEELVDVVGPLCTPLDTVARQISLPRADCGDLIGIFQSGAYARSASPLGFLSHPAPPEVWVDGALHRLIRSRGRAEDYMRDQYPDGVADSPDHTRQSPPTPLW